MTFTQALNAPEEVQAILERCYLEAEKLVDASNIDSLREPLGDDLFETTSRLAQIRHAARGVALTLASYKAAVPTQDIRAHKSEHLAGFSARAVDTDVTVPFLMDRSLPYNVQTHWLSQTFSFAGPYVPEQALKTVPKAAGPLLIAVIQSIQSDETGNKGHLIATLLLARLIEIRNSSKVVMTRPKQLSIDDAAWLLANHFKRDFKTNAPRLPQLAMYAIYQCLLEGVSRYADMELDPLQRMKSADRKAGVVGDVVVSKAGVPVEAVETKLDIPITAEHVAEAIEKIKSAQVSRYYVLSTLGLDEQAEGDTYSLIQKFRSSNGCEIIVNGVLETIRYYLRLLPDPTEFVGRYINLLEVDLDLDYEHRIAWNAGCDNLRRT